MRWWLLFFLVLGLMLCLSGVIHINVNLPPSLAFLQNFIPKSSGTATGSTGSSGSWLPSAPVTSTTYHMQGCSVDVPSGWTVRSNTAYNLTIVTSGRGFSLKTVDVGTKVDFDSAAFSNQILSQSFGYGFKVVSDNRDRFQGCPAYTVLGAKQQGGSTVYTRVTLFTTGGGQGYFVVASMRDADPSSDSQLTDLVNSVKVAY